MNHSQISNFFIVVQEWADVAQATLRAEFPSWCTLSAFDVFNLNSTSLKQQPAEMDTSLNRLAKTFGVNPSDLKREYSSLRPAAESLRKNGLDNRSAWRDAFLRAQRRSEHRKKYESEALAKAAGYIELSSS